MSHQIRASLSDSLVMSLLVCSTASRLYIFTYMHYADIYLGNVVHWNDAKIQQLNPGFHLPSTQINLTYDSSTSGVSTVLASALQSFDSSRFTVGISTNIQWPVPGEMVLVRFQKKKNKKKKKILILF